MQHTYFTPGPSHPYPRLREFLNEAWRRDIVAISHRGKPFTDIYSRTTEAIRLLMGVPSDYEVMFVGSATEAMERIIQGVVVDRSHHFINGEFAEKWFSIAEQLGKHPTATRASVGRSFPSLSVPPDAELVCITHNETSIGAIVPGAVLRQLTNAVHHPLVALDVVSSAPMTELPWSALDLVFFSVQKAFGLPAGLGVLIASPRAIQKSTELQELGLSVGSYHSLPQLAAAAMKHQTPATPNVLGIYLLGSVAEDMLDRGVSAMRAQNLARAEHLYKILSSSENVQPFVVEQQWRSPTVIVATVKDGNSALVGHMWQQRLILGKGYKDFADEHVRIANFPTTDDAAFEKLINHLREHTLQ
jgi:phosphoserine aminotransferase